MIGLCRPEKTVKFYGNNHSGPLRENKIQKHSHWLIHWHCRNSWRKLRNLIDRVFVRALEAGDCLVIFSIHMQSSCSLAVGSIYSSFCSLNFLIQVCARVIGKSSLRGKMSTICVNVVTIPQCTI